MAQGWIHLSHCPFWGKTVLSHRANTTGRAAEGRAGSTLLPSPRDAAVTPCHTWSTPGMLPRAEDSARGSTGGTAHQISLAKGEAQVKPPFTVVKVEIKEQRESIHQGLG